MQERQSSAAGEHTADEDSGKEAVEREEREEREEIAGDLASGNESGDHWNGSAGAGGDRQPLLGSAKRSGGVAAGGGRRATAPSGPQWRRSSAAAALGKLRNRKSIYRWLNVRGLDRSRLIVFTMCLAFVVYIVFSSVAWLGGEALQPDGRVVIVRVPSNTDAEVVAVADAEHMDPNFLVWNPHCAIPALDPLAADVMKLFHRETYSPCTERPALTYIERPRAPPRDGGAGGGATAASPIYRLRVNATLLGWYNRRGRIDHCCYQRIERAGEHSNADMQFKLGTCVPLLNNTAQLPDGWEFVLVRCKSGATATYTNAHTVVRERPDIRRRLERFAGRIRRRAEAAVAAAAVAAATENRTEQPEQREQAVASVRPLSVLMLAIDSISRLNLLRAMPLTAQHLYDTGWFELQGYNKIDDNTFPNLMAILLGYNSSLAYSNCTPTVVGGLDACPFIWTAFRRAGYVTAYGEDEVAISTFNYRKKGFLQPPTDYYLRPYMLAAQKHLRKQNLHSLTFCLGHQHSADHVYRYALDFATHYRGDPYFGLFWTNTFSHNDISDPSSMDSKIRDYLYELHDRQVLNDSAVVFFSDHGIRFGPVRHLRTGWLEERLPFMFVWLPEWFRRAHPQVELALRANRNRLTNPYDLHLTLQHVLRMATAGGEAEEEGEEAEEEAEEAEAPAPAKPTKTSKPKKANSTEKTKPERPKKPLAATDVAALERPTAASCPNCQSLFEPVPWDRSCAQIAIDAHWCTCTRYKSYSSSDAIVLSAVRFVLKHCNDALRQYDRRKGGGRTRCAQLTMRRISYAGRAEAEAATATGNNGTQATYMLVFEAAPSDAWFEATVRHDLRSGRFRLTGSVSRLNAYAAQSECMPDDTLRKFCYCLKRAHG